MSWSVTVNDLSEIAVLPPEILAKLSEDNVLYGPDAQAALTMAQVAGLVSATLSGGRTPSPYGGPDTVVISVIGFSSTAQGHAVPQQDFLPEMLRSILYSDTYSEEPATWRVPEEQLHLITEALNGGPAAVQLPGTAGGTGGGVGGDPEESPAG